MTSPATPATVARPRRSPKGDVAPRHVLRLESMAAEQRAFIVELLEVARRNGGSDAADSATG